MLNKEEFKKMMTKLREADENDDAIAEAFRKSGGDYFNEAFCYTQEVAIDALESALGDDDETISYYVYELNWGERGKDCIDLPDGTEVSLTNLDELYDYITSKNKPPEHDTEVVFSIPAEDIPNVNALELIHDKTDDCYIVEFEDMYTWDTPELKLNYYLNLKHQLGEYVFKKLGTDLYSTYRLIDVVFRDDGRFEDLMDAYWWFAMRVTTLVDTIKWCCEYSNHMKGGE